MTRINLASSGVAWTVGLAIAVFFTFIYATVVSAQEASGTRSFDGQYSDPAASSGVAGPSLSVLPDTGGLMILLYLGVLAVAGGGLVLLRRRALRSR